MADVKMMQGCDLSHWDASRYQKIMLDETTKFNIIKATEGKTGFDRYCDIMYNFRPPPPAGNSAARSSRLPPGFQPSSISSSSFPSSLFA